MKLRITSDSVRFRLKQSEVLALENGDVISEACSIGVALLTFSLTPGPDFAATFSGNRLEVTLPVREIATWASSEQVGMTMQEGVTEYLVEKDFRCLTPAKPKDNEDTFPNPSLSC